ncbi:hypothetical protein WH5701_04245 [Synechococcus sp. WH 5701]|nr:hypothetical protein WH5701_04245 [Synechococcus sp. WH 5701]
MGLMRIRSAMNSRRRWSVGGAGELAVLVSEWV